MNAWPLRLLHVLDDLLGHKSGIVREPSTNIIVVLVLDNKTAKTVSKVHLRGLERVRTHGENIRLRLKSDGLASSLRTYVMPYQQLGCVIARKKKTYRNLNIVATRSVRLIVVAQERSGGPVDGRLKATGQGCSHTPMERAFPILALCIGQYHDAVADGANVLVAWLLGLGKVINH
jgi:hypothetical protein